MQDITKTKCKNKISTGTEGKLIDKRDGKIYWVAKLKDSLCWMTQNLAYDGGAVEGYDGSDVVEMTPATDTAKFENTNVSEKLYYNPGNYVYTLGSKTNACSSGISTGLGGCTSKGWVSVSELESSWKITDDDYFVNATSYIGIDGQSICIKDAGAWFGNSSYSQCKIYYSKYEHYLAGNYYNWYAATNGTAVDSDNASGSICPTGWSLPTSNSTSTGSFGGLVSGLSIGQITVAPYYFVYSGGVNSGTLGGAGSYGDYWSATAYSASDAYDLRFANGSVNVSFNIYRYLGYPVRCVAR